MTHDQTLAWISTRVTAGASEPLLWAGILSTAARALLDCHCVNLHIHTAQLDWAVSNYDRVISERTLASQPTGDLGE